LIEPEELQTLIPHKGKMLLLDRVIDYNIEGNIQAEYNITEDCLFYDPSVNGVPSWAGFEFMAQAVSALSGIRFRSRGEKPKIGFILNVQSVQILIPVFKNGSSLDIRMNEIDCTDMIYTYEGKILVKNEKIMEGRLMVMETNDEKKYRDLIEGKATN